MVSQFSTRCFGSSSTVIPSTPGLPLFCFTRFNAALALPRSTTSSMRRLVPGRSFPLAAVDASLYLRGFTPALQREHQLPGLLAHGVFETHGRPALLLVWPFALDPIPGSVGGGHPCPAPRALLRPLLTSRSALRRRPFGREARPPQVRVRGFHRATAGSTSPPLGRESFAVIGPLALDGSASYPIPV